MKSGGTSGPGHMWYEIRDNKNNIVKSYGWSTGSSKFKPGLDNLSTNDSENYIPDKDHPITSITRSITKEQFDILDAFPYKVLRNEIYEMGTGYETLSNSCIDLTAIGLAKAKLVDANFEGLPLFFPRSVENANAF